MSPSRSILNLIPLRRPIPVSSLQKSSLSYKGTRQASSTVKDHTNDKKAAQQDRSYIDRQSDENALSGTDDAVAQQKNSFDPSQPADPAHAKYMAGKDSPGANPLEVSAANPEVSSAVREDGVSRKEKDTVTYASSGSGKSKQRSVPESKAYAGSDSRKPDRPQDVRAGQIPPGSR